MKSTLIGYIMGDHHSRVVVTENKTIGDCDILVAECLAVQEAFRKASPKGYSGGYHPKWCLVGCKFYQWENSNFKENCKFSGRLNGFKESRTEYCNWLINREVDDLAERAHMKSWCTSLVFWIYIYISFLQKK